MKIKVGTNGYIMTYRSQERWCVSAVWIRVITLLRNRGRVEVLVVMSITTFLRHLNLYWLGDFWHKSAMKLPHNDVHWHNRKPEMKRSVREQYETFQEITFRTRLTIYHAHETWCRVEHVENPVVFSSEVLYCHIGRQKAQAVRERMYHLIEVLLRLNKKGIEVPTQTC